MHRGKIGNVRRRVVTLYLCAENLSSALKMATVFLLSSVAARKTRMAISPLLAASTLCIFFFGPAVPLPFVDAWRT
jgi:hypothetical protein